MKIGVPKEIKNNENRVGLTPANVVEYCKQGHDIVVEQSAGLASAFTDEMYIDAGAKIVDAKQAWGQEMVIKVKEPQIEEYQFFYDGLILFTYLHLAAEPVLTKALLEHKVTSIAYETIMIGNQTPLLRPMSEVAGRRSVGVGTHFLEKHNGGKGILLSGTPGVKPAKVTIIGGGIAGFNAAIVASGQGADVSLIELGEDRIRELQEYFKTSVRVLKSNFQNIYDNVIVSDLVISTVLIPGDKAPKLITEEMVKQMEAGSVIVDISIDQGGSVETIDHATTHDDPIFVKHDILHYSVANMPGAVPKTATEALTNATLKYGLLIAKHGLNALDIASELKPGLNTKQGELINPTLKHVYHK